MGGEVLRIGPFTGGLNLASDVSSVADEELVVCKNFELDIDGSLKNRPPFVIHATSAPTGHKIIGTAVFAGVGYIFSSGVNFDGIRRSTDGVTWTIVSSTRRADVAVQYQGKVWFPSAFGSSDTSGASWDPIGGTTAVAGMPQGSHAVIHKERMYLVPGAKATTNESRLRFSDPADLTTWGGSNFIDVSAGDGETLNALIVYNDNLLLFKDDSVFVLAYDLNPSDAILREINPVLGTANGDCVVQFENVVYILHEDVVYEVVNYDFNPINIKSPFVLNTSTAPGESRTVDFCLSLIGERLVVKYFAKLYVFGLRTRTWSEWSVTHEPDELWHDTTRFYKLPNTDNYFTRRAYEDSGDVIKVPNNPTVADAELTGSDEKIRCTAKTKDFDMADPVHFKRLFWWSADILSGDTIIGTTIPVTNVFQPVWNDLTMNWSDIPGPWSQLLMAPAGIIDTVAADNNFLLAKTIPFIKSLRFRKINFQIELDTEGRSVESVKLFSLTANVLTKQRITQKVN